MTAWIIFLVIGLVWAHCFVQRKRSDAIQNTLIEHAITREEKLWHRAYLPATRAGLANRLVALFPAPGLVCIAGNAVSLLTMVDGRVQRRVVDVTTRSVSRSTKRMPFQLGYSARRAIKGFEFKETDRVTIVWCDKDIWYRLPVGSVNSATN